MRRLFLTSIALLSLISTYGFTPQNQTSGAIVSIINRDDRSVTQITDGDSVRLHVSLPQPVMRDETIDFLFDDTTVGSCLIPNGNTACKTDPFPALGWHWDVHGEPQNTAVLQAGNDAGEVIAQSAPITIKPRPVVMAHGFISNWETWKPYLGPDGFLASLGLQGFAVGDGQVPGVLNTGDLLNPTGRTNTIGQNAEILGQYIAGVKQQTGAEMVDLVVHSMGGMISRYYIDRVMQERDVAQLIMLGSPMGGSDCSVLPAALGFYLPASIEIRQSYMTGVFNRQITRRRGVEFYDLGGTVINESFKSPCTDIPNDTVVSFASINAIPLQSSQLNVIHSDLTLSRDAFDSFVKPLLQKPAGAFLSPPDPFDQTQGKPAPVTPAASQLQFTRVYTGRVDAGGSTELTINIDQDVSVASFALFDPSRSVTTIVRGASGNVIQLDPQTNGFIRIDDPSSLFYLGYGFQNPRPGPWRITIQATETTPADGTDFAISVYFVGGAALEATSSTLVPQINDTVEFVADLSLNGQSLEITEAQAVIKDLDGNVETLDFPPGRNVSITWTPRQPGVHAVDIVVIGLAPDGSTLQRTDFLAIEVQPSPGRAQITFNLIVVIGVVLLILFLILFVLFRGVRKLIHRS
jgi:pimeloyl-ACP methyl ester carboxylesterase